MGFVDFLETERVQTDRDWNRGEERETRSCTNHENISATDDLQDLLGLYVSCRRKEERETWRD